MGVMNKAFWLMSDGGGTTFNGVTIPLGPSGQKLTKEDAFRALTRGYQLAGSNGTYPDVRRQTVIAAVQLWPNEPWKATTIDAAFRAVKVPDYYNTPTPTVTRTPSRTRTMTATPTLRPTRTNSPPPTRTFTPTPRPTRTNSPIPLTSTPTLRPTRTNTPRL